MSIRTEKVAEEIKHQMAMILSRDLGELHLGLVTVTAVRISRDLKNAKVYLSFIGNKEPGPACVEKINTRKKQIRMHLGKNMHLRFVPELDFYFDDNIEYASRIEEVIKEIHKNEPSGKNDPSDKDENAEGKTSAENELTDTKDDN